MGQFWDADFEFEPKNVLKEKKAIFYEKTQIFAQAQSLLTENYFKWCPI